MPIMVEAASPHPSWLAARQAGLLLSGSDLARFVARGFLRFDGVVDHELNQAFLAAIADGSLPRHGGYRGQPLAGAFPAGGPVERLLALPRLRGIIASLVGPEPLYDHHAVHVVEAGATRPQGWHADSTIDARAHFDLQLLYFPHDTPRAMGGTMILPGSQLRRIHEFEVASYHNFVGQLPTVCAAGTVLALHHGLWHCAQPNHSRATRWMFKLRLQPTFRQTRLYDQRAGEQEAISAALTAGEPWMGTDQRLEIIQRIRLWRLLCGDPGFDCAHWLGRLENDPQRPAGG
jgi:hypothetical protein